MGGAVAIPVRGTSPARRNGFLSQHACGHHSGYAEGAHLKADRWFGIDPSQSSVEESRLKLPRDGASRGRCARHLDRHRRSRGDVNHAPESPVERRGDSTKPCQPGLF